jgi:hypothetical protein
MKKHIINLFGFISIIGLIVISCEKKTEPSIDIQVTINKNAVDQVALALNSLMSYEFTVQSSEQVGRLELMKNVNGVSSNISVVGYSTGQLEKVAGSILVTSEMKLTLNVYSLSNMITATKTIQAKIFATTNAIIEITLTSAKTGVPSAPVAFVGAKLRVRQMIWLPKPAMEAEPALLQVN